MPVYNIDLHAHCDCDPHDVLNYSPYDMVNEAVDAGLNAFAITPHGKVFHDPDAQAYAEKRGILLIPGIELLVSGFEILLLNVRPDEVHRKFTFDDLRKLRKRRGPDFLTVAPHPFYPRQTCVGPMINEAADCLDAVEHAHFYTPLWNPNQKAIEWARKHGKPLVANSDMHILDMFACQYTEVEAPELSLTALFDAIRASQVRAHTPTPDLIHIMEFAMRGVLFQGLAKVLQSRSFF